MTMKFINGPKALLSEWKNLRTELTADITDLQQLEKVVNFWSKAPISTRVLDWDNPVDWLDAWELINSMEFDESNLALAMFYTLLLGNDRRWTSSRLNLKLVTDKSRQIQTLVLEVDRKFLLNLEYNSIVEINNESNKISVQYNYSYDGKKHFVG